MLKPYRNFAILSAVVKSKSMVIADMFQSKHVKSRDDKLSDKFQLQFGIYLPAILRRHISIGNAFLLYHKSIPLPSGVWHVLITYTEFHRQRICSFKFQKFIYYLINILTSKRNASVTLDTPYFSNSPLTKFKNWYSRVYQLQNNPWRRFRVTSRARL